MAKATNTAEETKASTYIVVQQFRDKDDFDTIYEAGDDVSTLDTDRLQSLVDKGLVQKND